MKVNECVNFNSDFPESFLWGSLDSYFACNITNDIINELLHDIKTIDRNLVPRLKKALLVIANHAEV